MNAAQALEFRRPYKSSPIIESFIEKFRMKVDFITEDKVMYQEIDKAVKFLQEVEF